MQENCQSKSCESAGVDTSGRLPAASSGYRQTWEKPLDSARPYRHYPDASFRAKRGFKLDADVLPAKPVQTASAATPLPSRRKARTPERKARTPEPLKAAEKPPLNAPPAQPGARLSARPAERPSAERKHQQAVMHAAGHAIDGKSPPIARWKRGRRHPLMMPAGLFTGIFTAMVAFAAGTVWWMESSGAALGRKAMPPAPGHSQSVASNSGQPGAAGSRNNQADGPIGIAHVPATAASRQPPTAENQARPEQSRQLVIPEDQAEPAADDIPAPTSQAPRETADTPTPASRQKKESRADEKKQRAPRRNASVGKSERADEISRLKAQAFSETRKDRLGSGKSNKQAPAPGSGPDRSSAKKASVIHAFNQCKRKESFLEQEKCKWEICAGKWGQNGCPAYKHDVASY